MTTTILTTSGSRILCFERLEFLWLTKKIPHCAGPEISWPCSQNPDSDIYLNYMNLVHTSYFFKVHFNIILLFMPRYFKLSVPLRFPNRNLHILLFSSTHATFPAHLLFLDLTSDEDRKYWSSWICSFLHCPYTDARLGPNICFSTHLCNNPTLCYYSCIVYTG